MSPATSPSTCGTRSASASIAFFAWGSSSRSSFANARLARVDAAERTNCSTWKAARCSCSASMSTSGGVCSSDIRPRPYRLSRLHLLGVDLLEAAALLEPGGLPFRPVALRDREVRRRADLVGDGRNPLEEALEPPPGGDRFPAFQVEQLPGEAVADRAPHVLLQEPVRQVGQALPLVVCAGAAHGERVGECCERLRLGEVGLAVGDPYLPGGIREVGAHAPPDLGVLGHRAGAVEERDVVLPALPCAIR